MYVGTGILFFKIFELPNNKLFEIFKLFNLLLALKLKNNVLIKLKSVILLLDFH